jgi:hypothetical protein
VRLVKGEFGRAKVAHKRAKKEGPLPLAVEGMLELTPRLGQANADRNNYDFSLVVRFPPFFRPFQPSPGEHSL